MPPHPTTALAVTAATATSFVVVCVTMVAPFLYRIARAHGEYRVGHYVLLNEMTRARMALQSLYLLRGTVYVLVGAVYLIMVVHQYATSVPRPTHTNGEHATRANQSWTYWDTLGVVVACGAMLWGALLLWWGW